MVRLVFRPYTRVRRAICTSAPLRASTRVSSGFALLRHSSPSFGSQHSSSRWVILLKAPRPPDLFDLILITLLSLRPMAFIQPSTRCSARLLGPCFKTGRIARWHANALTPLKADPSPGCQNLHKEDLQTQSHRPWDYVNTQPNKIRLLNTLGPQIFMPQFASPVAVSSPWHSLFRVLSIFPSR